MSKAKIVLGLILLTLDYIHGGPYDITSLPNSPGLYFERTADVRLKVGEWIVATSVNSTNLHDHEIDTDYFYLCKNWTEPNYQLLNALNLSMTLDPAHHLTNANTL